jgi:Flp pilus assembly protein TadG
MRRRRILRSQSGQSLVEVALLAPVLLALLVGIIEFGRYAYLSILVANAARAGAAYGAQSLPQSVDTAGIQAAANNDFQNGQSLTGLTVTFSTSCGCDNGGTLTSAACTGGTAGTCASGHWVVAVSVQAKATFNSLFGFPGIPKSITVTKNAAMRVDQN